MNRFRRLVALSACASIILTVRNVARLNVAVVLISDHPDNWDNFEWCGDWTPFGDDGSGSYNTPVAPFMRSCPNMQVGKIICQTLKTFSAIPIFELGDEKVLFRHLICNDNKIGKDLDTP